MEAEEEIVPRRRRRKRWITLALLVLLFLIVPLIFWTQRWSIATNVIDRELARRGVQARYRITRLGLGTQRLENVVIGDPARPDLVARSVEITLSYGLRAPEVHSITARGVRMFGRIVNGKLSLGEIDKLLPPPTGAPFQLPDIRIDIADTAMALDTPGGRIGLAMEGRGNLADGFDGRVAAVGRRLAFGDCAFLSSKALLQVSVSDRRPQLDGPVQGAQVTCGQALDLRRPSLTLDVLLTEALDGWIGSSRIRAAELRSGGTITGPIAGRLSFNGDSERTRGKIDLAATNARTAGMVIGRAAVDGSYDYVGRSGEFRLAGSANAETMVAPGGSLEPVTGFLRAMGGTPIEPIGEGLADAVERSGRRLDARGRFRLVLGSQGGSVRIEQLSASSASGARLHVSGGRGLTIDTATGETTLDGRLGLSGGGFPSTQLVLRQSRPGAPMEGTARIAPMLARGARLALQEVRFAAAADGTTRVETVATLDGPLDDGYVKGLVLPIRGRFGRGRLAFGEDCTPLSFTSLRYSSLRLAPTQLSLCPVGPALVWKAPGGAIQGEAEIARMRLSGRLGSSPITLDARQFRLDLDRPDFASRNVAVRLGNPDYVNRLDLATFTGRITDAGVVGTFAGGSGQIANVPLLLSEAKGRWQVVGGKATVDAAMTVADDAENPRFYPLQTNDFHLTLVDNRIEAAGWLTDPQTGTQIMRPTIDHALDSGRGSAILDVPGIRFDESYQPEELTRLTTGVVALVDGVLKGRGEIAWGPEGTTSTGSFSTEHMDLAASFGPVTGLKTTMNFTDLLGLVTAPSQLAEVERIQAGIDVFDGEIRYQLLPDLRVRVESGHWPFAGGELFLEETVIDFSKPSAKHLTFRVVGLDAAIFVQQMEFGNIAATGTFDGVVPMIFDERGGRIVEGHLRARPQGGVVSYVGELTDRQLGTYGKLAFDALKSLSYTRLSIELNGALDGEFVAAVELDGVAREAPAPGGIAGYAIRQLAKIPFEFNITARGPFRALIGMMRSFEDPTALIQSALPPELRDQPTDTSVQPQESTVQPQESETMR